MQVIQAYLIEKQWQPNVADAKKAARRMIRQLRERNYILCLRGPRLYGFVHRTFLEYLTAAEYVRRFDKQPQQMTIDELVALCDQHSRDDDWREVLRLICGQIDEQFVGRIVEQLATRTDLEKWDGKTPLPELPLAVCCLSELRSTSRIERAGSTLMQQTIVVATKAGTGAAVQQFLLNDFVAACRDLGTRWSGHQELTRVASSQLEKFPRFGYGPYFWPHLVAHVTANRVIVADLAILALVFRQ